MSKIALISIVAALGCLGCSQDEDRVVESILVPQEESSLIEPKLVAPARYDEEWDETLWQSFVDAPLTVKEGKVVAIDGSAEQKRMAEKAQAIVDAAGIRLRTGAKVLLSEEVGFNRLVFQRPAEGGAREEEYTILTDKNNNEAIVKVVGFYSGPLPQ